MKHRTLLAATMASLLSQGPNASVQQQVSPVRGINQPPRRGEQRQRTETVPVEEEFIRSYDGDNNLQEPAMATVP